MWEESSFDTLVEMELSSLSMQKTWISCTLSINTINLDLRKKTWHDANGENGSSSKPPLSMMNYSCCNSKSTDMSYSIKNRPLWRKWVWSILCCDRVWPYNLWYLWTSDNLQWVELCLWFGCDDLWHHFFKQEREENNYIIRVDDFHLSRRIPIELWKNMILGERKNMNMPWMSMSMSIIWMPILIMDELIDLVGSNNS